MPDYSVEALRDIAAFLPIMEAPNFQFTDGGEPLVETAPNRFEIRGYVYDPQVWNLVRTVDQHGWIHGDEGFQWTEWIKTDEARTLRDDPAALDQATPEQLARLITIFARQERFSDGAMLGFWRSGLLLGILRRAAELARAGEGQ